MRSSLVLLALVGCGGGEGGDCPAFTRIVDGSFARDGTTLTWTLEVEELPAELPFDREGIPSFVLEYGWTVELDSNSDGVTDWEVSAGHFKEDRPPRVAAPLDVLQVNLWRVEEAFGTIAGFADATISGNAFVFAIDEDEEADLANVVDPSQSTYTTFHQAGPSIITDQCTDRL